MVKKEISLFKDFKASLFAHGIYTKFFIKSFLTLSSHTQTLSCSWIFYLSCLISSLLVPYWLSRLCTFQHCFPLCPKHLSPLISDSIMNHKRQKLQGSVRHSIHQIYNFFQNHIPLVIRQLFFRQQFPHPILYKSYTPLCQLVWFIHSKCDIKIFISLLRRKCLITLDVNEALRSIIHTRNNTFLAILVCIPCANISWVFFHMQ